MFQDSDDQQNLDDKLGRSGPTVYTTNGSASVSELPSYATYDNTAYVEDVDDRKFGKANGYYGQPSQTTQITKL